MPFLAHLRKSTASHPNRGSVDLEEALSKIDRIIAWGRLRFPIASENLCHWRDGKGRKRTLGASVFKDQGFLNDHLKRVHRAKFIAGAERRIREGVIAPGQEFPMHWTDSIYAPYLTDLFFALGAFTVRSEVSTKVVKQDEELQLTFELWRLQISDDYDWDPGKATYVPGVGRVTDDEMLAMERAGYGKAYRIESEWITITRPDIVEGAVIKP